MSHDKNPQILEPIELRDDLEQSPMARAYVHDKCGAATVVTDEHLRWMSNPLRFTGSTVCMGCGEAQLADVRWADSAETITDFRSRMYNLTPGWVKRGHYVLLPLLWAAIAFVIVAVILRPQANAQMPAPVQYGIIALACLVGGALLQQMSPLAELMPSIAKLQYWKYK